MRAVLLRLVNDRNVQTLGRLYFFEGAEELLGAALLELPDRGNAFQVSRINAGRYKVVRRWSERYGWHLHITDVEGRTLILIHAGNYYTDTKGCLLPGTSFTDINQDGYLDTRLSRRTLNRILELTKGEDFWIDIIDLDKAA